MLVPTSNGVTRSYQSHQSRPGCVFKSVSLQAEKRESAILQACISDMAVIHGAASDATRSLPDLHSFTL